MSFEKKSLINNMTATKKAIIASSPASPSVGSKVASKNTLSKNTLSKNTLSKNTLSKNTLSKNTLSKAGGGALPGLTFSKAGK